MQTVFQMDDLRKKILEIREIEMKKQYIKNIYVKWKNNNGLLEITTNCTGKSHTPNTMDVTWSIKPKDVQIDDANF